jgi:putative DNA primase/helicase
MTPEQFDSLDGLRRAAMIQDGYEAYDQWQRNPLFKFPKDFLPALRLEDREQISAIESGGTHPAALFTNADDFLRREMPLRKPLLIDARTGGTVLYESSINQIFAYRGIGKSVVVNALLRPLVTGKDWLHFRATERAEVVLVDGELPLIQLQERLREFTGTNYEGRLKILSPELLTDEKRFPVLSNPADQERFFDQIGTAKIIVFDTLSSIFKFDTNDADQWAVVNDFLRRLRFAGHCVLLVHHAGKNNTQRGRTDGDDHLDVSIQLHARSNWQPGDGLQFEWRYEKVRHGAYLPGFEAAYDGKTWAVVEDDRADRVAELVAAGKSERQIAVDLGLSQKTVNRIKHKAEGLAKLNGLSQ